MAMICITCKSKFPDETLDCPDCDTKLTKFVEDPLIGTLFAERYLISDIIGRGGMSVVYVARHTYMNNEVAIKILNQQLTSDPISLERFRQEAEALSKLKHKNIVSVMDFGVSAQGQAFLIMDFLRGESLEDFLENHGSMPLKRAISIFAQACDGLAQAHAIGIIHRDIKPSNIVVVQELGDTDVVKIVDFGIAKLADQSGKTSQQLTQAGEVFGSPLYMSPEQCKGTPLDARSDIYSLGCVMYEMFTELPPLIGDSSFDTMNKHVAEVPLSLRGVAPNLDIPVLIDKLVLKALRKEPEKRQQSMAELKAELIKAAEDSRIYLPDESDATYVPKMYTGGETGERAALNEGGDDKSTRKSSTTSANLASEESAVAQQAKTEAYAKIKDLRNYTYMLTAAIVAGIGLVMGLLLWPGPADDRVNLGTRLAWMFLMSQGDGALEGRKLEDAARSYRQAADMARGFQDSRDRLIKSLTALLRTYHSIGKKLTPNQIEALDKIREELTDAEQERMRIQVKQSMGTASDLTAMADLQMSSQKDLDPVMVEGHTRRFLEQAKKALNRGEIIHAMTWLSEAEQLESTAKGGSGGAIAKTANEICSRCESNSHMQEVTKLLQRVVQLEIDTSNEATSAQAKNITTLISNVGKMAESGDVADAENRITAAVLEAKKLPAQYVGQVVDALNKCAAQLDKKGNADVAAKVRAQAKSLQSLGKPKKVSRKSKRRVYA